MFTKTFHSSFEAYKRTLPNSYFTTYPKLNDINNTHTQKFMQTVMAIFDNIALSRQNTSQMYL